LRRREQGHGTRVPPPKPNVAASARWSLPNDARRLQSRTLRLASRRRRR